MRLIDADALRADCNIYNAWDAQIVKAWLDDQPTIDAAPVVRCKDCVYCRNGWCRNLHTPAFRTQPDSDWYCADGEQRDGDKNE